MGILSFLPLKSTWQYIIIGLLVIGIGAKFWHMSYTIDKLNDQIVALEESHKQEVIGLQKEVALANVQAEAEKANALNLQLKIEQANTMVVELTTTNNKIKQEYEAYKKTKPLVVERIVTRVLNTDKKATLQDYVQFNTELSKLNYKDLK